MLLRARCLQIREITIYAEYNSPEDFRDEIELIHDRGYLGGNLDQPVGPPDEEDEIYFTILDISDDNRVNASELIPGDTVAWTDPDSPGCSRVYKISSITTRGDIVKITERDGSCLECHIRELKRIN